MMLEMGGEGPHNQATLRSQDRWPALKAPRLGDWKLQGAILAFVVFAIAASQGASAQSPSLAANQPTASAPRSPYACEMVGGQRLAGSRVDVVFRPSTEKIQVGETFSLLVLVCPHAGVTAPASVVVDATLPERGHGMNYKPIVKSETGGRQGFWYRVEGMMFHTVGRWELQIDVRAGGHTDRLRHAISVE